MGFKGIFVHSSSEQQYSQQPEDGRNPRVHQQMLLPSCLVVSDSLWPHGLQPIRLLCPWSSPGKNTGVGCHALLQGIFPTQGSNPGLLHCRQILWLSHQGSPRILEWVTHPFSRGSSQPRNRTGVSYTAALPAELPGKPNRWMGKQNVVYSYNRILFILKKGRKFWYYNMNEQCVWRSERRKERTWRIWRNQKVQEGWGKNKNTHLQLTWFLN